MAKAVKRRARKPRRGRFVDYRFNIKKFYRNAQPKFAMSRSTRHAMSFVARNFCKKLLMRAGRYLKGMNRIVLARDINKAAFNMVPQAMITYSKPKQHSQRKKKSKRRARKSAKHA